VEKRGGKEAREGRVSFQQKTKARRLKNGPKLGHQGPAEQVPKAGGKDRKVKWFAKQGGRRNSDIEKKIEKKNDATLQWLLSTCQKKLDVIEEPAEGD